MARAVGVLAQGYDVHRISIVARGQSHGHTLSLPTEDRLLATESELTAQLAVLLAGRVAEEIVFGDPTTGAEDDLARATTLAEKMVRDFGMSRAVGLRRVARGADVFRTGGDAASAAVSPQVDDEVGRLIDDAHARAVAIVTDHRVHLDQLADRLVSAETLDKDEIDRLLAGAPRQPSGTQVDGPQAIGAGRRRQPKGRVLGAARTELSGSR